MVNLSSKKRVLAGVAAIAGFAALAMPVQAAQATGGVPPQVPAAELGKSAESQAKIQGTQATTLASSNTNIVRYNKLYKTGAIAASKCKEVNVSLRTAAGVKAYDQQMVNCMWAAWAPTLKAAGANYRIKPTLVIYSASKAATKCGTISYPTSYFCGYGAASHIYIPWAYIAGFWKQSPTYARAYATNTIAHEYGHHVQFMTGILSASWSRQYAFTTNAAKLEESRRRELQASCLGSAMIGANKRYYPMAGGLYTQWKYLVEHSGDVKGYPRDHGSFANHGWWSHAGFYAASSTTSASRCNTFNAASSRVS